MKTLIPRSLLLIGLALRALPAAAAVSYSWSGPQAIPDNNGSGLAYHFNLSDAATAITDVSVTLNISGGYNGDLYAYISHGAGFAVLLNQAGRTATSEYGYSTPGFAITFNTSATADIHNYQSLGAAYNGNGQVTGSWAADGRNVAPGQPYAPTERTAGLGSFTGVDPNGDWVIYFRDASAGGISYLNSFSVGVTAVPEPVNVALGVFAAVTFLVQGGRAWRRHRRAVPCQQGKLIPEGAFGIQKQARKRARKRATRTGWDRQSGKVGEFPTI